MLLWKVCEIYPKYQWLHWEITVFKYRSWQVFSVNFTSISFKMKYVKNRHYFFTSLIFIVSNANAKIHPSTISQKYCIFMNLFFFHVFLICRQAVQSNHVIYHKDTADMSFRPQRWGIHGLWVPVQHQIAEYSHHTGPVISGGCGGPSQCMPCWKVQVCFIILK